MSLHKIEQASSAWASVAPIVFVPRSEEEYARLVSVLDALIDTVGEDEQHRLASLMDVIGTLIERYEDEGVAELTNRR